jgi:hypothetical protein
MALSRSLDGAWCANKRLMGYMITQELLEDDLYNDPWGLKKMGDREDPRVPPPAQSRAQTKAQAVERALAAEGPMNTVDAEPKANIVKIRPRDIGEGTRLKVHGRDKHGNLLVEYLPFDSRDWRAVAAAHGERLRAQDEQLESFVASCRTGLEILGTTIPQIGAEAVVILRAKLGVVEDILSGAVERYTG